MNHVLQQQTKFEKEKSIRFVFESYRNDFYIHFEGSIFIFHEPSGIHINNPFTVIVKNAVYKTNHSWYSQPPYLRCTTRFNHVHSESCFTCKNHPL